MRSCYKSSSCTPRTPCKSCLNLRQIAKEMQDREYVWQASFGGRLGRWGRWTALVGFLVLQSLWIVQWAGTEFFVATAACVTLGVIGAGLIIWSNILKGMR